MALSVEADVCNADSILVEPAQLLSLKRALGKEKFLSCIVLQNDQVLLEYYRNRKVESALQRLNSCTKSVLSALVGIAIERGLIPGLQAPLTLYFPQVLAAQTDLRKQTLTVYHLLTMTAGFDWPEFGEWHYFAPMAYQADICRFVLNRPLSTMPGTAMNYNSGCSHLLAAILQQTAGVAVDEFAKEVLFKPLGITNFRWYADHQGINKGADGLRLTAVDMARFGSLYLHQGRFGSQQIISPDWIRASTTACFTTYPNIGSYSYHWWVAHSQSDHESPFFFALGFGGQYIFVVPKRKIVAVFTSELYTNTLRPLELFRTCVLN